MELASLIFWLEVLYYKSVGTLKNKTPPGTEGDNRQLALMRSLLIKPQKSLRAPKGIYRIGQRQIINFIFPFGGFANQYKARRDPKGLVF